MTENRQGVIYALIAATGMGSMGIFAKLAYELGATPLSLLTIRFGLGSLLLWVYLYWQKQLASLKKKQILALVTLGTIYGLMSFLFFTALKFISASMASLLLYTAPIIVVIIGVAIGDEPLTLHKTIAVTLASMGLYFVLDLTGQLTSPVGITIGLATGLCYAIFLVGSNRYTSELNPLLATAVVTATTFALQFTVSIGFQQFTFRLAPMVWVYGIAIAILSTAIGIASLYKSIQLIGPGRASIVATAEPAVTVGLAAIVFSERLTLLQITGGILILAAIIIIQLSKMTGDRQKREITGNL